MRGLAFVWLALWFGAAASAQAALQYRAAARVEASVAGQTNQHVVLVDPPSGGFRSDTSDVRAGREVFLSGLGVFDTQIVAQGLASARGSANGLRAEVWSSQQQLNPFQGGSSNGHAEATLYFTTTVQGAPGSSGTVRLDTRMGAGVIPAPFGGTARSSYAGFERLGLPVCANPRGAGLQGQLHRAAGLFPELARWQRFAGFRGPSLVARNHGKGRGPAYLAAHGHGGRHQRLRGLDLVPVALEQCFAVRGSDRAGGHGRRARGRCRSLGRAMAGPRPEPDARRRPGTATRRQLRLRRTGARTRQLAADGRRPAGPPQVFAASCLRR
jgi:hypothetical protein